MQKQLNLRIKDFSFIKNQKAFNIFYQRSINMILAGCSQTQPSQQRSAFLLYRQIQFQIQDAQFMRRIYSEYQSVLRIQRLTEYYQSDQFIPDRQHIPNLSNLKQFKYLQKWKKRQDHYYQQEKELQKQQYQRKNAQLKNNNKFNQRQNQNNESQILPLVLLKDLSKKSQDCFLSQLENSNLTSKLQQMELQMSIQLPNYSLSIHQIYDQFQNDINQSRQQEVLESIQISQQQAQLLKNKNQKSSNICKNNNQSEFIIDFSKKRNPISLKKNKKFNYNADKYKKHQNIDQTKKILYKLPENIKQQQSKQFLFMKQYYSLQRNSNINLEKQFMKYLKSTKIK